MKFLQMLGLAIVATVALTALLGAGTASATVLCKTTTDPCTAPYAQNTEIQATLVAGIKAEFDKEGFEDKCESSTFTGKTANAGKKGETVKLPLETLTLGKCECEETKVMTKGTLEIFAGKGGGGSLASNETRLMFKCKGISCEYHTVNIVFGVLNEPPNNTSDTTLEVGSEMSKIAGGVFCHASLAWVADYTIKSPVPLYVAES